MADFYSTTDAFATYHELRGNDVSAYDDEEIEAALIIASEFIDHRYLSELKLYKTGGRDQVRLMPMEGLTDRYGYSIPNTEIPREVLNATNEAALVHLVSTGALFIDYTPGKYESVSIDGALSVKFAKFNYASEAQTQFPLIDAIMRPLLKTQNSVSAYSGSSVRA